MIRILLGILGGILVLDAIWLLAQNKIHLGILLPLLIGLILIIHAFFWSILQSYLNAHPKLKKLWTWSWGIFVIWLITVGMFFYYLHQAQSSSSPTKPFDAIIVLGSGLIQGQPSPTLQMRLDKAAEVYKYSPQALIVVTGGLGHGQNVTEASVMALYLKQQFQIRQVLEEKHSTSTALNLKNSRIILQQHGICAQSPIALVTSDFHTLRAQTIAEHQGYRNITSYGAKTPLETRYNAWLREYFAYISGWVLREY